ncbi:MAG: SMP-30/gluconolactonase/LRE family protein [Minwuia sp.]|uniref:SMP-30/gluconolactonase/LRE family protein n=1 Tax=Minwuia sp. TaxID=2493630 RepID=UPI003A8B60E7
MIEFVEITSGLQFPEGPIWMPDGSVILVEIQRGTLSRVAPDGRIDVIAETGGGPNGAAIGPDGKCYICNNGGFTWGHEGRDGEYLRPTGAPADYTNGWIERVDLQTGEVEVLYEACDGHPLQGPNDIVFDAHGGFWFTDLGKRHPRRIDLGGVYYAKADGSEIREVVHPLITPNGIGLSPDGTRLYVAETEPARVLAWDVTAPGELRMDPWPAHGGGEVLAAPAGYQRYDSLAVEANGNVCVATLINGGITVVSPDGTSVEHLPLPDPMTTNICFGGGDLRTAFITLSATGRLVSCDWARPGTALNF